MSPPFDYSVVIPVYNGERFLRRALASVARQPHAPEQIFVVDDGSVDRSREIAIECGATVVESPHRGVSHARNLGIAAAESDWVAFLDCDDIWTSDHIGDLADAAATADCPLVTSPHLYYDGDLVGDTSNRVRRINAEAVLFRLWGISASGTAVRRARLDEVGGFDESISHCEDLELWLRVVENGYGVTTARPSVISDRHDSHASQSPGAMRHGLRDMLTASAGRAWLNPTSRQRIDIIVAYDDARPLLKRLPGSRHDLREHLPTLARRPLLTVTTLVPLMHNRRRGRRLVRVLVGYLESEREQAGMSSAL